VSHVLAHDPDFKQFGGRAATAVEPHCLPVDYLFLEAERTPAAADVFAFLRWGGQVVIGSPDVAAVESVRRRLKAHGGFASDLVGGQVKPARSGWRRLRPFRKPWTFLIARKILLLPPGETTDRFVFDVSLARAEGDDSRTGRYVVRKRVPSYRAVASRLRERAPQADPQMIADRAHKLVDHVFPVFLSREAAFLKLLQRDLPEPFRTRVPHPLGVVKDERGMVRELRLRWLRIGGPRLSQLDFATQAAELLHALHENARVIHLDLRLDNVVVTPQGVGFVDFGSAVRMDEDLSNSPMLSSLFDEMMSTSQIQKLLGKLKLTGRVTSRRLVDAHQRIDPAADLFYLGLQISRPTNNPQLDGLIEHEEGADEDLAIKELTRRLLRPTDPEQPTIATASDLLRELRRIKARLRPSRADVSSRATNARTAADARAHAGAATDAEAGAPPHIEDQTEAPARGVDPSAAWDGAEALRARGRRSGPSHVSV